LFVVGPVEVVVCRPVSLLLLQAEVWLVDVVVVCVKPALELGGFVTAVVVVVVPQSLVLAAWAGGENQRPPTPAKVNAHPISSAFRISPSYSMLGRNRQWPPGVPPPLLVVGPVEELVVVCRPVSLLLLQAEVWVVFVVVVVVCVKPALEFGGFVTPDVVVVVVVPQSLVLAAWAGGENQSPPTAVNTARVVATIGFLSAMDCSLQKLDCTHRRHFRGTTRRGQVIFG